MKKSCKKGCCEKNRACVVCCGKDCQESVSFSSSSSSSSSSCTEFSSIVEDKKRTCCVKKKDMKEKGKERCYSCNSSCDKRCDRCSRCDSCCFCRVCKDYTKKEVLRSLCDDSDSSCESFRTITEDRKRVCCMKNEMKPKTDLEKTESCNKEKKGEKNVEGKGCCVKKEFRVSFVPKKGHPWERYVTGDKVISVNGKVGPVIHLNRGRKYYFTVEQTWDESTTPSHLFILTDSPSGGSNSVMIPNSFQPIAKGTVAFHVTKETPKYFFYQDMMNPYLGGLVIVHE